MSQKVYHIIPASSISIWAFVLVMLALIGILVLYGRFMYWSKYTSYEVDDSQLRIQGGIYSRIMEREQLLLDDASIENIKGHELYGIRIRTNGIGLPGFKSGWFTLKNGEKALLFVTDQNRVLRIPTKDDFSLLLTVDDPEGLLNTLRNP